MKLKDALIGTFLIFIALLAGCGGNEEIQNTQEPANQEAEQLKIYATLYPLEDFAKKIGGDHVVVKSILPPDADAHTYEPTSKEMVAIAEADAFIFNGIGMESYAEKIITALEKENVMMVEAGQGVEEATHSEADETEVGHEHGEFDPHIWLDPNRAIMLAENIKNALIELNPQAKDEFENNFDALKADLEKLDEEFQHAVSEKKKPQILVSHAAFGYWEQGYGIHQIAVSGLSSTNEPSQKQLENIINIAREENIKYVIFEQNITSKVAEIIRNEIKAEPLRLHNLAVLTEEDVQNGEDYFSLMRKNLEVLNLAME